jgi:hypothetical protein
MAAGSTYTPIATQTLGSSASTVTFSSIPSTYTDLVLVAGASMASGSTPGLQYNGDTGTSYSRTILEGNGSSASSSRTSNANSLDIYVPSSPYTLIFDIQNYSNTTTYKTTLYTARTSSWLGQWVGLWRNTNAITSLSLTGGSSFAAGSVFTLYGIAAA